MYPVTINYQFVIYKPIDKLFLAITFMIHLQYTGSLWVCASVPKLVEASTFHVGMSHPHPLAAGLHICHNKA